MNSRSECGVGVEEGVAVPAVGVPDAAHGLHGHVAVDSGVHRIPWQAAVREAVPVENDAVRSVYTGVPHPASNSQAIAPAAEKGIIRRKKGMLNYIPDTVLK